MKKAARAILIVFAVIIASVGALAVWKREYVKILIMSFTNNSEKIAEKQESNSEKLVKDLNDYLDEKLREPTDEEQRQIDSGELMLMELYSKILAERSNKIYEYNEKTKKMTEKEIDSSNEANSGSVSSPLSEKDAIVSKYVSQLYALQSSFSSRIEGIISQAEAYYINLRETQDKASARANTISHFTSSVSSLEGECDSQFDRIVEKLESELKAAGEDTSIIKTIKSTYNQEKQLKMSYYINKYIK